jgi:choline dehydrogenase
MMEGDGGSSLIDEIVHDGRRKSIFRSYTYPRIAQPNLTVLTGALVTRLIFEGRRAIGVNIQYEGKSLSVKAAIEIVLSLGAIQTPKLLMQSGIGDEAELTKFGLPVIQHLPGVGRNLHDHVALGLVWEATEEPMPVIPRSQMVAFWKTRSHLEAPNFFTYARLGAYMTPENAPDFKLPPLTWTMAAGMRPLSRGSIHLTGPNACNPLKIEANYLADSRDLEDLKAGIEQARAIGNAASLRPYTKGEVAPGELTETERERFIRNGLGTFWHQSCTAKMGRDSMSVVNGDLKVYGVNGLTVADASILPSVTTGNTMAPCVVIGERASNILQHEHGV